MQRESYGRLRARTAMGHQLTIHWVLLLVFTLACSSQNVKVQQVYHVNNVCSTWGNYLFKTFDGDIYRYDGYCTFNLVSACHGDTPFHVHITRQSSGSRAFINKILATVSGVTVQMKRDYTATSELVVDDNPITLPYYSAAIKILQSNDYIKLLTNIGLTVIWNQDDAVTVELESRFMNNTCGLCGDYNGYLYDGSKEEEWHPEEFLIDYEVNDPEDPCEPRHHWRTLSDCSDYRSFCEEKLNNSAFSDCHSILDTEGFIEACMLDLCVCEEGCDCSTVAEYSRQCLHAGGRPGNWRSDEFCPKNCSGDMIYQESGSPCVLTCSHLNTQSLCVEHNMDGCFCPEGTVQYDYNSTTCVSVEECPCKYQDNMYESGETVDMGCQKCQCFSGRWSCAKDDYNAICSIEGGAHFTTFYQKQYTFHGDCNYVLFKESDDQSRLILGDLTPCTNQRTETCLNNIKFIDEMQNAFTFRINDAVEVLLNDQPLFLPYITKNVTIIHPTASSIIVQSFLDLQMQIQLSPKVQLYIYFKGEDMSSIKGLCSDFISSGGLLETASTFADSWKNSLNCKDQPHIFEDPCSSSIENKIFAEEWCGNLKNEDSTFSKCHSTVDPKIYYERCVYDSCSCPKSEPCMCAAISSYVKACADNCIILSDWRPSVCDMDSTQCPPSQIYLYNMTTYQPTCRSLGEDSSVPDMEFYAVEGCGCPLGEYLDEKHLCVQISECSCFYKGQTYPASSTFQYYGDSCTCEAGHVKCSENTCPEGKFYFDCSKMEDQTAYVQRSCRTQNLQTECVSGCVCPDGLLDNGQGQCVPQDECPCVYQNSLYKHGDQISVDCNKCSCQRGEWSCTSKECYGTCTVYGSGHYATFDNRLYDFEGNCEYILAQDYCDPNSKDGTFSVITENIPCGTTGVTCSKSIKVLLGSTTLYLADDHLHEIEGPSDNQITYLTHEVGIYIVIEANNGIILIWDKKTSIFIKLSPKFKGNVCGLCGNFDDKSSNDLLTSNMLEVSSVLEFGNSWKLKGNCPDVEKEIKACSQNPYRMAWAEKRCYHIKSEVFKDCHSKVDPITFYEACVNDVCSCDSGGDCECFCTAVSVYAQECNKAGSCIHWRTPEICPIFCDYYNTEDECEWHYKPCGDDQMPTCHSIYKIYTNISHLEGCYARCPPETPIFDEKEKKCVRKEECGCYVNKMLYPNNMKVPSDRSCEACVCTEEGKVECTYDSEACICVVDGKIYKEGETISIEEQNGLCYEQTCINGTLDHKARLCLTPSVTPVSSSTEITATVAYTSTAIHPTTIKIPTTEHTTEAYGYGEETTTTSVFIPTTEVLTSTTTVKSSASTSSISPTTEHTTEESGHGEETTTTSVFIPTTEVLTSTTTETSSASRSSISPTTEQTTEGSGYGEGTTTTSVFIPTTEVLTSTTTETSSAYRSSISPTTEHTTEESGHGEETTTTSAFIPTTKVSTLATTETSSLSTSSISPTTEQTTEESGHGEETTTTSAFIPTTKVSTSATTETSSLSTSSISPTTEHTTEAYGYGEETTTTSLFIPTPEVLTSITTETSSVSTSSISSTTEHTTEASGYDEETTTTTSVFVPTTEVLTSTTIETSSASTSIISSTKELTTEASGYDQETTTTTSVFIPTTEVLTSTTTVKSSASTRSISPTTEHTTDASGYGEETTSTSVFIPTTKVLTPATDISELPTTSKKESTPYETVLIVTYTTKSVSEHELQQGSTTPPHTTKTSEIVETSQLPTSTLFTTKPFSTTTSVSISPSTPGCCQYKGKQYSPGAEITEVVFNELKCYKVVCLENCNVDIASCETTLATPTSTPSVIVTPGCQLSPPRKYNEIWTMPGCFEAQCLGDNNIKISKKICPRMKKISCVNRKTPVLVSDDDEDCCMHYECPCECSVYGDPHYETFDGTLYDYQGPCTYVLVEEIQKRNANFTIYVSNDNCGTKTSCPRRLITEFEDQRVEMKLEVMQKKKSITILVNGQLVGIPFIHDEFTISNNGEDKKLYINKLNATIIFNSNEEIVVKLPYKLFAGNTRGQCGTCTNNKADDCMLPDGTIVKDCVLMAGSWAVTDTSKPGCIVNKPTTAPKLATIPTKLTTTNPPCSSPLCNLLNSTVFQACHSKIDPSDFIKTCMFDNCFSDDALVKCSSLQRYARLCSEKGICIDWRKNAPSCSLNCSSGKVYKACGPAEQQTCESNSVDASLSESSSQTVEGCFCPEDTTLFSLARDVCVKDCGCVGPDKKARKFGETFVFDCRSCICMEGGAGISCEPRQCPIVKNTCTEEGLYPVTQISATDRCCNETVCRCDLSLCPVSSLSCDLGFQLNTTYTDGQCCPKYTCDRKDVCIYNNAEYKYGDRFVLECQDCECREGHFEITCSPHECPLVETTCDEEGFYPVTYISSEDMCCNKTECRCNPILCSNSPLKCDPGFQLNATFTEGHCCPIYTCVPKNVCVYNNAEYLPDTRFYENCTVCECLSSLLEVRCNPVECAAQCDPGFEPQYNSSSCCPECIQTQCVLNINGSTLLIKLGESITRDCTTFNCPSSGVGFEIGVSDIICPPFDEDECRPENIQLSHDGCCKTCNKKNGCKLKTYLQNVTSENCQAQVLMTRCEGLCETYSMYSSAANEISHTCNCCRDTETSIKSTTLLCQDGNQISYMYTGIDQCGCMGTVCGLPQTQP